MKSATKELGLPKQERIEFVPPKNPKNGYHSQNPTLLPSSSSPASNITPTTNTTSQSSPSRVLLPPPIGLVNTGTTCYFNSALQCLFACPNFVSFLCSLHPNSHVERTLLDLLSLHVTCHLNKPVVSSKSRAIEIHALFKLFRSQSNGRIRTHRQEDAHEALVVLFDQLEKATLLSSSSSSSSRYTATNNPIVSLFGSTLVRHIACPKCKFESKKMEPNLVFSVDLLSGKSNKRNTVQALIENTLKRTTFDKDNKWECGGCKVKVQADTFYTFDTYPDTFILHLKRFCVNPRTGREEKLVQKFSLEGSEELLLDEKTFDLVGVLVHQGMRTNSGHYFSYVKCAQNKAWYQVDDEIVTRISSQRVLMESQAYLLFYTKRSRPLENPPPPLVVVPAHVKADKFHTPPITESHPRPISPKPALSPSPPSVVLQLSPKAEKMGFIMKRWMRNPLSVPLVRSKIQRLFPLHKLKTTIPSPTRHPAAVLKATSPVVPVLKTTPPTPPVVPVLKTTPSPVVPVLDTTPEVLDTTPEVLDTTVPAVVFSFDQKKPVRRKSFGDGWDELLDKGKVKKVKRM